MTHVKEATMSISMNHITYCMIYGRILLHTLFSFSSLLFKRKKNYNLIVNALLFPTSRLFKSQDKEQA